MKGKIIGLKNNVSNNTTQTLFVELIQEDGKYDGVTKLVNKRLASVYGQSLRNADLMYNIHYGDIYNVKLCKHDETIFIGHMWIGDQHSMNTVSTNLSEKKITRKEFNDWVHGNLPDKSFFLLDTEEFEGVVESVTLLESLSASSRKNRYGGIVRITKGSFKDVKAFFNNFDFYVNGIKAEHTDMRYFIRTNDKSNCE